MANFVRSVTAHIELYQVVRRIGKELLHERSRFIICDVIVACIDGCNRNREIIEAISFESVFEELHVVCFTHAPGPPFQYYIAREILTPSNFFHYTIPIYIDKQGADNMPQ